MFLDFRLVILEANDGDSKSKPDERTKEQAKGTSNLQKLLHNSRMHAYYYTKRVRGKGQKSNMQSELT